MLDTMAQGRACCGLPAPAARGVPGAAGPVGICVCDFQEHFGIGQSKVSYHLRVLKEAGLVREEPRGRWSLYTIDGEAAGRALDAFRSIMRAFPPAGRPVGRLTAGRPSGSLAVEGCV
jgi:ArsR family transcriptional regulator